MSAKWNVPHTEYFAIELDAVRQFNRNLSAEFGNLPDQWSLPIEEVRLARDRGLGPLPFPAKNDNAQTLQIASDGNPPVILRHIAPAQSSPEHAVSNAFLHIHGGGWVFGASDHQDDRLSEIADRTHAHVFSVEYRLAPEHPFPAALDDCECAARWLLSEGAKAYGLRRFAIGGESAGANLSLATLLRLKANQQAHCFTAAVLIGGAFDLSKTPSVRLWDKRYAADAPSSGCTGKLLISGQDIENYISHYLGPHEERRDPEISPLFGVLDDMPPAIFIAGTADPLLDDSLFMASRYAAAGNSAQLKIYALGCHVFQYFDLEISRHANDQIDQFLGERFSAI